jgi:hypothetical protein
MTSARGRKTRHQFAPSNLSFFKVKESVMATNPKVPDSGVSARTPIDDHARVHLVRQSKFPWPIMALIVGAVLLLVIIAVLPKAPHILRTPSAPEVPRQPTAEQIQFTKLKIVPAPAGGALYLTGLLHNIGNSEITGVQVQAQFLGRNGPILETVLRPVEGVDGGTSQDLTKAPIKPNEARPIRIYFEHAPKGWNRQIPELTVTSVTGTTP